MSPTCLRCGLRITSDLVNWQRVTERGELVGYICPRCQRADHSAGLDTMLDASPEGAQS